MARSDWLVGGDRGAAAAERIYAAATDVIARDGFEAFDIDALAVRVHCSRATIYRHAGGKAEIRDAVLVRAAARIVEEVRWAVPRSQRVRADRYRNHCGAKRDPIRSARSADDQLDPRRRGKDVAHRVSDSGRLCNRPQRADGGRHRQAQRIVRVCCPCLPADR